MPPTALQTDERRTSVVTYCEMTLAPLAAGRQSYADARSEAVKNPRGPTWLSDGHRYYSQIGPESTDPVRVFSAGDEEVSNEKPGTLCVHLEPASRFVRVFDADTHIRPSAESIRPYLSSKVLERIPDLDEHRVPIRTNRAGKTMPPPHRHWFRFRDPAEASG